jgi:hypothetical protein
LIAASRQSFLDPSESRNNPNSDYYTPTQLEATSQKEDAEKELAKYTRKQTFGGEAQLDEGISW